MLAGRKRALQRADSRQGRWPLDSIRRRSAASCGCFSPVVLRGAGEVGRFRSAAAWRGVYPEECVIESEAAVSMKPHVTSVGGSPSISRVLYPSRGGDHLSGRTGLPGARCARFGAGRAALSPQVELAPGGVYPAGPSPGRWWSLTPPFQLCRQRRRFLFCGTFTSGYPDGMLSSALPCGARTFLALPGATAQRTPSAV